MPELPRPQREHGMLAGHNMSGRHRSKALALLPACQPSVWPGKPSALDELALLMSFLRGLL